MLKEFFSNEEPTPIDEQIESVLLEMKRAGVTSDEYQKHLQQLEQLHKIKASSRRDPVSRDTVALIAGNLLGILLIVAYEQRHVMTSQGFRQIIRPR